MKSIKTVVRIFGMIIIFISVVGTVGSHIDMIEYNTRNDEPEIVSVEGQFIEIDELPSTIEWDDFYDGYKPVKMDFVLYNPANTMLSLNGSIADYDAETEYRYCSVITEDSSELLIDHYYYCDVLPADCTAEYTEYVRVPEDASHVVVTTRTYDDEEPQEFVVILE